MFQSPAKALSHDHPRTRLEASPKTASFGVVFLAGYVFIRTNCLHIFLHSLQYHPALSWTVENVTEAFPIRMYACECEYAA